MPRAVGCSVWAEAFGLAHATRHVSPLASCYPAHTAATPVSTAFASAALERARRPPTPGQVVGRAPWLLQVRSGPIFIPANLVIRAPVVKTGALPIVRAVWPGSFHQGFHPPAPRRPPPAARPPNADHGAATHAAAAAATARPPGLRQRPGALHAAAQPAPLQRPGS